VGRRMHRDCRNAQLLRRAKDAQCNLAAIGNEDFLEHDATQLPFTGSITINGSPYSTAWPSSIRIAVTTPPCGALISLNVFMASTSRILSPALTFAPTGAKGLASGLGRR